MPESPDMPRPGRASVLIAAISTIVEWYDFTLYLYLATVLSRVFYGGGQAGLVTTLGGFAAAYLLRPLGAIVFGHFGDRIGRRRTMLVSVALMTVAMAATAILPTHAQAGAIAGGLLFLLRCLMGFSVGGEYGLVVAYLVESAPPHRRALVASLASAASEVGALLAVGVCALTVSLLAPADLDAWGWRIPFAVGTVVALGVWVARSAMTESPEFLAQQAQGSVPSNPLRLVFTRHRAGIGRAFAISALGSITYYVGITYVPAFLTSTGAMTEVQALKLSTIAAVAVIAVTPLTGWLADRHGSRPVLLWLAGLSALLPALLFHLMAAGPYLWALAGAVVLACVAGAVSAVGAPATAEQFPGAGRVSGLALGQTTATAIFGGLTPWAAQLLVQHTGSALGPGLLIAAVALCVLPVLVALPRR